MLLLGEVELGQVPDHQQQVVAVELVVILLAQHQLVEV